MTIVETSIKVSKPVEKVFEFLTSLDDMKKMSQYITGIEADGPLKLGSKYTIKTSSNGYNIETKNERGVQKIMCTKQTNNKATQYK